MWGILAAARTAPDEDLSPAFAALAVALFFTGHTLTRGANLQKFYFKTASPGSPERVR